MYCPVLYSVGTLSVSGVSRCQFGVSIVLMLNLVSSGTTCKSLKVETK